MRIDDKVSEGVIIACDCDQFFTVEKMNLSLECPHCGATERPEQMLADWYERAAAPTAPAPSSTSPAYTPTEPAPQAA